MKKRNPEKTRNLVFAILSAAGLIYTILILIFHATPDKNITYTRYAMIPLFVFFGILYTTRYVRAKKNDAGQE